MSLACEVWTTKQPETYEELVAYTDELIRNVPLLSGAEFYRCGDMVARELYAAFEYWQLTREERAGQSVEQLNRLMKAFNDEADKRQRIKTVRYDGTDWRGWIA